MAVIGRPRRLLSQPHGSISVGRVASATRGAVKSESVSASAEQATLLAMLEGTGMGARVSSEEAREIDAQVSVLQTFNPTDAPWQLEGKLVDGKWNVLYSTEEDTQAFQRLPLIDHEPIFQTVDAAGNRISNTIRLRGGNSLVASAPFSIIENEKENRIEYFFDGITLQIFGITLPTIPLGEKGPGGWSETVYLGEKVGAAEGKTLRIIRNFRGDLIILER